MKEIINQSELKVLVDALYREVGEHGVVSGYMKQHRDGEFTAEFWESYDVNDEEFDDELTERIGLVFSETCWDHMLDLVDKYPELIDRDVEVKF